MQSLIIFIGVWLLMLPGCVTQYYCYQDSDGDGYRSDNLIQGESSFCNGAGEASADAPVDCDDQSDTIGEQIPYCPDKDGDGHGSDSDACIVACIQPSNYVNNHADCNDTEPEIWPSSEEQCNGVDDDCDGVRDDGWERNYQLFVDGDGDGFGNENEPIKLCSLPIDRSGLTDARGDCDDGDETRYPGANDPTDTIDQDCGGSMERDPHIGLSESSYTTIQSALNAAQEGVTIWVGPGTYEEYGLSFASDGSALRSTIPTKAIINGAGKGVIFSFDIEKGDKAGELDGMMLTGGNRGITINGLDPAIMDCIITGNIGTDAGGGVYLYESAAVFTGCDISHNTSNEGGGIYISGNTHLPRFLDCVISDNTSTVSGGGVCLHAAGGAEPVTFDGCIFERNSASFNGGAIHTESSVALLTRTTLTGNTAMTGGGIRQYKGVVDLENCILLKNRAASTSGDSAGAIAVTSATLGMTYCTLAGNESMNGLAGIHADESTLNISRSILALNVGYNLSTIDSNVLVTESDLYSPSKYNYRMTPSPASFENNLELDPLFFSFRAGQYPIRDDLHLRESSPLKTGPQLESEWGVFGGNGSDTLYYSDDDNDGMYDGWEQLHGLDSNLDDANENHDTDEFDNLEEFTHNTDPANPDTDGDGFSDSDEEAPLDWYDQPGINVYPDKATVPGDFESLQSAINAISNEGDIVAIDATYYEELFIYLKQRLTLTGLDSGTTIQGFGAESVVRVGASDVSLGHIQVTKGWAVNGGGIQLVASRAEFADIIIQGNTADQSGGGIFVVESDEMVFSDFSVTNNSATQGGGIQVLRSTCNLSNCSIQENSARESGGGIAFSGSNGSGTNSTIQSCSIQDNESEKGGGGIALEQDASVSIRDVSINGNIAATGGGIYSENSQPSLIGVTLAMNEAINGDGAGMTLRNSRGTIQYSSMIDNVATGSGGGAYVSQDDAESGTSVQISHSRLEGNEAMDGGALAFSGVDASLANSNVTGNHAAGLGGGLYVYGKASVGTQLSNTYVYRNSATNGGGIYAEDSPEAFESAPAIHLMINCILRDNRGLASYGGGLFRLTNSIVTNTAISGNTSTEEGIGGIGVSDGSMNIFNSVLAYNQHFNLFATNSSVEGYAIDLYSPDCEEQNFGDTCNYSGVILDSDSFSLEPGFLAYGGDEMPFDYHLGVNSPLQDAGSALPSYFDLDGSRNDIGAYGGPGGGGFDLDLDSYPSYFWVGGYNSPPPEVDPGLYDADDFDPVVH